MRGIVQVMFVFQKPSQSIQLFWHTA